MKKKRTLVGNQVLEPFTISRDTCWFYASRGRFQLVHYRAAGQEPTQITIPLRLILEAVRALGIKVTDPRPPYRRHPEGGR